MAVVPRAELTSRERPSQTGADETLLAVMDRYLRYVRWTRDAERLTGLSPREVLGRSFYEVFPEAAGSPAEAQYLRVLRGGSGATISTELDGRHHRVTARMDGDRVGVFLRSASDTA